MNNSRSLRAVAIGLISLVAPAAGSHAAALRPGQYDLDGIQQLCLLKDGSAYMPTYTSHQSLFWKATGYTDVKNIVWGNADDNTYYEAFTIAKNNTFNWIEQSSEGESVSYSDHLPITFVKKQCDPKPPGGNGQGRAMQAK